MNVSSPLEAKQTLPTKGIGNNISNNNESKGITNNIFDSETAIGVLSPEPQEARDRLPFEAPLVFKNKLKSS